MNLPQIAYKYLTASRIRVSKDWLQQRINSHPYYPALVSLTDTLDELGLVYNAVRAEKKYIPEFSFPFLAQTPRAVGGFEIVYSMKYYELNKEAFLNRWEGIAIMVEPAQKTYNKGHDTFIEKEKKGNSIQKVTLGIGLVLFLFFQTFHFNFIPFVFSILSIVGMTICFLTISHKHGKANVVTSRLCNNEKTHSCDLVLNSSAAEIIKGVDFGDVGLMYFSGLLLLSTFSQISQNSLDALSLLLIPCSIALALTFFTLYYQWKILKVWCKMCLLIVAVVWLQEATILILLVKTKQFISTSWPLFILQFSLSFSLTPIWLLIKPLLKAKMIEKEGIIGLLMWKRNPEIFQFLLLKQTFTDSFLTLNPVRIGLIDAPLQFTIISNPFCSPCAIAHKHLEELYNTYPNLVSVSVIFPVQTASEKEDRRTVAVEQILNAISTSGNTKRVLSHWFEKMSIEAFSYHYPNLKSDKNTFSIIQEYSKWTSRNNIPHTPLVLLNGYPIPKQYKLEDISSFVLELSDSLLQQVKT